MSDEDDSKTISVVFLFFSSVLALVVLLSKALHSRPKLNALLSEPAMVLLLGIFCSLVIPVSVKVEKDLEEDDDYAENTFENIVLSFPSNIFFMVLLPPILFNSGYQLERELFYRHIKPITLFAAMGTAISGLATGFALYGAKLLGWFGDFDPSLLELLTFGALIAATDTVSVLGVLQTKRVDPHLFSLVFGESALNDAVAIILFRTLSSMLENGVAVGDASLILNQVKSFALQFSIEAFGSPALGMFFSFLMALVFKNADLRETKVFELSLYILVTLYIPYQIAELAHLSGIITIFFVGMSARRYIEPNVSDETKTRAEAVFKVTAYIAEVSLAINKLSLFFFGFVPIH